MKSFFHFTTGEWCAAIALLIIIMSSFIYYYFTKNSNNSSIDSKAFQNEIQAFETRQKEIADSIAFTREKKKRAPYKGYFEKKRSNSSDSTFYSHYNQVDDSSARKQKYEEFKKRKNAAGYAIIKIDINTCDTAEITKIPLLGSKRALKIVEYREKLGGYYSFSQLKEIFILQDIETAHLEKYFFIDNDKIKKIEINKADYKQMIRHPYFDAYLTKSIITYRSKNEKIESIDKLQKIINAYPELIEKISPYLSFE